MYKVPLFKLNYDDKEKKALQKVINSKWLTMGQQTATLEKKFSNLIKGNVSTVAVSSCTAAIHLSLLSLDLKKNDEIIVPSLSFISQINVIKNLGAKPILIDCTSLDNWNIDIEKVKSSITKNTKAIIILHYAGFPCLIDNELKEICKKKKILIVEDVAHAPGAKINNIFCGAMGDVGCFSFFSNKNISAGEGGIITTKNKKLANKLRFFRSHGMTQLSLDRTLGRTSKYDVVVSGLNYRIDELRASLANVQISKLKKANLKRKKIFKLYQNLLNKLPILFPFQNIGYNYEAAYHIFPILIPKSINRQLLIDKLKQEGIQTSVHYPAFWSFSIYKKIFSKTKYPFCKEICDRQLTLPLFPTMKEEDVRYVFNKLKKLL
ncbi:MAG: DegT/DnrJ/EryC1/StrS aminotransferase [Rhodospirillaceae bacterium]|nr:DegT/DnrJ/EryC1/StrS aminotransferase [Rhodospirillaceae bacterium]|tara:strand:+ start:1528 stop:2661 length:1134 start_codon:yes stop_codon:yes gene_type:complete